MFCERAGADVARGGGSGASSTRTPTSARTRRQYAADAAAGVCSGTGARPAYGRDPEGAGIHERRNRQVAPGRHRLMALVLAERRGPVGLVTLNRPEKLNALSSDLVNELEQALRDLDADDRVGAIVITGAG